MRDALGVMDHGGFTKYRVEGPKAEAYLSHMFCGGMPRPGHVRLSYMLTPKGRIWSEATIARLAEDRFLLCGPTLADLRDYDWLAAHLPSEGVTLARGYAHDAALMVMGPKSRDVLSRLTDADFSAAAAPWLSVAEIEIAGAAVTAMRVSYVGELGWELHLASADLVPVYQTIMAEGRQHGIGNFGSYALNVMRIEKGYHSWGADFGTEYTLYDAGLSKFANLTKGDFIGRAAVEAERRATSAWTWVGLEIEEPAPDPMASDPIIKDDAWIGYVTSATRGFRTGKILALGYAKTRALAMGERCAVTILGEDRPAKRHDPHVYDPDNERLNA